MDNWKLKRTKQCKHCPWKVDSDLNKIPGYKLTRHFQLADTIETRLPSQQVASLIDGSYQVRVMSCHSEQDSHCIGWINNQVNQGNNILLRLELISCSNSNEIEVFGEQHETFEDTLP